MAVLHESVTWDGLSFHLSGEIGIFKEYSSCSKENIWEIPNALSSKRSCFYLPGYKSICGNLDGDVCMAAVRWWNDAYCQATCHTSNSSVRSRHVRVTQSRENWYCVDDNARQMMHNKLWHTILSWQSLQNAYLLLGLLFRSGDSFISSTPLLPGILSEHRSYL